MGPPRGVLRIGFGMGSYRGDAVWDVEVGGWNGTPELEILNTV